MNKTVETIGDATGETGWTKTYARKWTPPAQVCGAWSGKMSQLEERTNEANIIMADALEAFGSARQIDKCIEELGELATVLMKFRHGEVGADAVIDELADVAITGGTMKLLFDPHAVDERIAVKLARLVRLVADQVALNAEKAKPVKPVLRWEAGGDGNAVNLWNGEKLIGQVRPSTRYRGCWMAEPFKDRHIATMHALKAVAMNVTSQAFGYDTVPLWTP